MKNLTTIEGKVFLVKEDKLGRNECALCCFSKKQCPQTRENYPLCIDYGGNYYFSPLPMWSEEDILKTALNIGMYGKDIKQLLDALRALDV